jgi:hypothetical protein
MSDGLLSIKHRTQSTEERETAVKSTPRPGSYRYFVRGKNQKPEQVNEWPDLQTLSCINHNKKHRK